MRNDDTKAAGDAAPALSVQGLCASLLGAFNARPNRARNARTTGVQHHSAKALLSGPRFIAIVHSNAEETAYEKTLFTLGLTKRGVHYTLNVISSSAGLKIIATVFQ